ncbi:unnamed protein product, partial [Pocillopora meandrina]
LNYLYAYVDRQSDLIDLTRCFVKLNVGFKTTGNANLTSCADAVATMLTLANNIINCTANGTLLTEQVDIYHLKAYFQTLLNFDRDDEETILQCQRWRNKIDSPATYTANNVRTNHADFDALSANHQASIKLQKADARNYYAEGKRTLRMKPFVDVFQQGKWIVPRTLLEFEFYLNATALFMNGEANPPNEAARFPLDNGATSMGNNNSQKSRTYLA